MRRPMVRTDLRESLIFRRLLARPSLSLSRALEKKAMVLFPLIMSGFAGFCRVSVVRSGVLRARFGLGRPGGSG